MQNGRCCVGWSGEVGHPVGKSRASWMRRASIRKVGKTRKKLLEQNGHSREPILQPPARGGHVMHTESYKILPVLMRRDGMSRAEAEDLIAEARKRVLEYGEDPEEVLADEFGLEPDYIYDLLG